MGAMRAPASGPCDAVIDFEPYRTIPTHIYALVKLTYAVQQGRCKLDAPEPLKHDIRDPACTPRLPVGTDFWWQKDATDVVVHGHAFSPGGAPVERMQVMAQVGAVEKRVLVTGRREIAWGRDGKPKIVQPERFTSVELIHHNAYGGVDPRVPVEPPPSTSDDYFRLQADHPGLYPRNPFGKGYLVERGPLEGAEMPQLEDPDDRLTDERLLVGDPRRWYTQPLPWCFHWVHMLTFPRYLFAPGSPDAWFPGPEDEHMPEVKRAFLPRGYRNELARNREALVTHPRFYQEASYGFILSDLKGGEPVVLEGMHPEEKRIQFSLPERAPVIELIQEGKRQGARPRLHSVVIKPAEKRMHLVYGATAELARPFIPGIHKHIPIAVSVNGDQPIAYNAPVPVKERLKLSAQQKGPTG